MGTRRPDYIMSGGGRKQNIVLHSTGKRILNVVDPPAQSPITIPRHEASSLTSNVARCFLLVLVESGLLSLYPELRTQWASAWGY